MCVPSSISISLKPPSIMTLSVALETRFLVGGFNPSYRGFLGAVLRMNKTRLIMLASLNAAYTRPPST